MPHEIIVKKNEELVVPILWTGQDTDMSYTIKLNGIGSSITFLALMLGRESQKVNLKVTVFHMQPKTKSRVIVKGVLLDKSSMQFDGLVNILPGAKGTNAWLAAHILLLSDQAKGVAVPSLEILENDIKAGHATTVGRVNDLELFYLMSRGISESQAKKLIVQGFLESVLQEFPKNKQLKARKEVELYAA